MPRNVLCLLAMLAIGLVPLAGSAQPPEILDPAYDFEEFVTFAGSCREMAFDDGGNLYVVQRGEGKILKVAADGTATEIFSSTPRAGETGLLDIVWTGGSVYGDYFFVVRRNSTFRDEILRIDPAGGGSIFADMHPPRHRPSFVDFDRSGGYGNLLYTGTGGQDHLFRVLTNGRVEMFSPWPDWVDGGNPFSMAFDASGRYGGQGFVGSSYIESQSVYSGLFRVDPDGSVSRFTNELASAPFIGFDPVGTMFDHRLFAYASPRYGADARELGIYRIDPDSTTELLVPRSTAGWAFTFGNDGAMYIAKRTDDPVASTSVYRVFLLQEPPTSACGDGVVDAGESCDDGNSRNGDGCRSDCTVEACGDAILDPEEACDDGNNLAGDGCRADCTTEACGDGNLDLGEECDDGNLLTADGCRSNCTIEECGDAILDPGEACDDGNDLAGDGCRVDCTIEACGDAIRDRGEGCDDGNDLPGDGCRSDCTIEGCGDAILDPGEECDDGDEVDYNGCRNDCTTARIGNAPSKLISLSDVDGFGSDEIAALIDGSIYVAVRDAASGVSIQDVVFAGGKRLEAVAMATVPDLDGNGAGEVAVLARTRSGRGIAHIRDCLTRRLIRKVKLAPGFEPLRLRVVDDLDGTGSPALVVLAYEPEGERAWVLVVDIRTRAKVRKLRLPVGFTPVDLEVNARFERSPEAVVLGRSENDGRVRVIGKAIRSGRRIADWTFDQTFFPLDLEVMLEETAAEPTRVAVLGETLWGGGRIWLNSLRTGEIVSVTRLGKEYRALGLEGVPNTGGAFRSSLAVLEESRDSDLTRVVTMWPLHRRRLGEATFTHTRSVLGLAVVSDVAGSPADEIAILGTSRCAEGSLAVTLRDAVDGVFVRCIAVP